LRVTDVYFLLKQNHSVSQYTREKIKDWLEFMRTRKGDVLVRLLKKQQTHMPSIQGVWTPFTNKPTWASVEKFPSDKLSEPLVKPASATQKLIDLANKKDVKE
jgi:large subunit ribosomal protein L43